MTAALTPQIKWAQRKDSIFITVDLQDCQNVTVKFDNKDDIGSVEFHGESQKNQYQFNYRLYSAIDTETSKYSVTPRHVFIVVARPEAGDHWPQLLKDVKSQTNVKVDWDKWLDQDDEETGDDKFDMNGMGYDFMNQGMGGMGGMGGMEGMGGMGGMGMGGMDFSKMAGMEGMGEEDDDSDDQEEQIQDVE